MSVALLVLVFHARAAVAQRAEPGLPTGHAATGTPPQPPPGKDHAGPPGDDGDPDAGGLVPIVTPEDDIDLATLGLDPNAPSFDDQLNVYGFASFLYRSRHPVEDHGPIDPSGKTFAVGNINLYLAKNLTENARTLIEIAFTFVPNGGRLTDDTVIDTTVTDPTNYDRPTQWGSIAIERAYLEYDLTEFLTIRAGRWLTPYGIWNIDHGAPVVISTGRPYIIGEQYFPEHQTGLDLFGSRPYASYQVSYHLTVSNGRGGAEAQQDQDEKFAFGGRIEVELPSGLRIGGSYYRGRYTGLPPKLGATSPTYLEASYGGDAQLDLGGFRVQGEVIVHDRHFETSPTAASLATDPRDVGAYALVGYRFHRFWNVMPFLFYEYATPSSSDGDVYESLDAKILGLNFRPVSSLAFKATVNQIRFYGNRLLHGTTWETMGQASWVF